MDNDTILRQAPIACPQKSVRAEWIDYNGHMNMAFYHLVFDQCLDYVFDALGLGVNYVNTAGGSIFTREVHVNYLAEATLDETLDVRFQLLDYDGKRLHFFEEMYSASSGQRLATSEQLALHVDLATRRSTPLPTAALASVALLHQAHQLLPRPPEVGRIMGIRRQQMVGVRT